jgi:hypothetical protein
MAPFNLAQLLNFDCDADLDLAFHYDADRIWIWLFTPGADQDLAS